MTQPPLQFSSQSAHRNTTTAIQLLNWQYRAQPLLQSWEKSLWAVVVVVVVVVVVLVPVSLPVPVTVPLLLLLMGF